MYVLRLVPAFLLLLLTAVPFAAQDEQPKPDEKKTEPAPSYSLRWNYTEGEKLSYRQVQTMKQDMFGSEILNVNTTDYTVTCLGFTEEGAVKLEWKYDRVAMKVEAAGLKVDYDSAKPDPDELAKIPELKGTAALVGKTFSYEITLELKIENLKGWDEIREQVLKEFDANMRSALEPTYSNETRINQLEAGLRGLPKEKVRVGDEWTNSFVEPAGEMGLMTHELKLKLDSVTEKDEQQHATITHTNEIKFDKFKDGPYADMNVTLTEGEGSGSDTIDMKRGAIIKQTVKQKITMEYLMGPGETLTHKMEIDVTVELLPDKKTEAVEKQPAPPEDESEEQK